MECLQRINRLGTRAARLTWESRREPPARVKQAQRNYELRITNYELRITNYELRITNGRSFSRSGKNYEP